VTAPRERPAPPPEPAPPPSPETGRARGRSGGRSGQARLGAKGVRSGVLARVRATYPSLSEAEQRVAAAILERPTEAVFLPVKALAQRIRVSEATIVRCCRSLGYSGLRELKLALAAETLTAPQQVIHEAIQPGDSVLTVARKVLQSDQEAIADTLSVLDGAALERAVGALLAATRIEFYGIGSSMPVALDAYYRFARLGLPATVVTDPHMQSVSAAQLPPGAVAFAISHTGRTRETLNALQKARGAGATSILLSSYANTPLSRLADVELVTASRETLFRTEALASRLAHLSLIDALYVAVATKRLHEAERVLARTDAIIAEHRLP
jgi:RpiR family carbohydrate utilization transcriptional regulator